MNDLGSKSSGHEYDISPPKMTEAQDKVNYPKVSFDYESCKAFLGEHSVAVGDVIEVKVHMKVTSTAGKEEYQSSLCCDLIKSDQPVLVESGKTPLPRTREEVLG